MAMSGGVDSSTAAALLLEQGHRVLGLTMVHLPDERHLADARAVCAVLGIPHHALDLRDRFRREVLDPFTSSYLAGRTPNPCALCNSRLKFRSLLDSAGALGADLLATGHYARVEAGAGGQPRLLRSADPAKDQSYFLFALGPAELARVLFPLGGMAKEEVRARAASFGLPVHDKPESQDACFLPPGGVREFLHAAAGEALFPGPILDPSGGRVGTHPGACLFTVGQRRGLGVASAEPLFVVRVDAAANAVVVGTREEAATRRLEAAGASWTAGTPPGEGFSASVRIRHRHPPAPATVTPRGRDGFSVEFVEPQLGVAPGQAAVLYRGDEVLGGGWIE